MCQSKGVVMSGGDTNESKPTYLGQYLQFKMLGIYSKRQHLNCETSTNTSKSFKVRLQTGVFDKHFLLADTSPVVETMYFYKYWPFSVFYRLCPCDPDERNHLCLLPNWAESCCCTYTPMRFPAHGATAPSVPGPHYRGCAITHSHTKLGVIPLGV